MCAVFTKAHTRVEGSQCGRADVHPVALTRWLQLSCDEAHRDTPALRRMVNVSLIPATGPPVPEGSAGDSQLPRAASLCALLVFCSFVFPTTARPALFSLQMA